MALASVFVALLVSQFVQHPINSKYILLELEQDVMNAEENKEGKNEASIPVPELGEGASAGPRGTSKCSSATK